MRKYLDLPDDLPMPIGQKVEPPAKPQPEPSSPTPSQLPQAHYSNNGMLNRDDASRRNKVAAQLRDMRRVMAEARRADAAQLGRDLVVAQLDTMRQALQNIGQAAQSEKPYFPFSEVARLARIGDAAAVEKIAIGWRKAFMVARDPEVTTDETKPFA